MVLRHENIRIIRLVIVVVVLVAALSVKANDKDTEYMGLIERADSAIAEENYAAAIRAFESAMRLQPGNANNVLLLSNVGMLHYYLHEDSAALATLNMAHSMAPASVTVLLNRAKVNNGLGKYSDALRDYSRIIALDSTLVEPWHQKGILQLRGGDVRGAEASLAKAAELEPDSRETFVAFALLYSQTNRPKEALPYLNQLIRKDPQSEYYAERAMCRLRLDDLGGASEDIADGLAIDAYNADLYVARALLNKRRFREKDAKADASRAVELGANPLPLQALGLLK